VLYAKDQLRRVNSGGENTLVNWLVLATDLGKKTEKKKKEQ